MASRGGTALYRDMYRSLRRLGVQRNVLLPHFHQDPEGPQQVMKGFAAIRRLSAARASSPEDAPSGPVGVDSITYQCFLARVVNESAASATQ